MAFIDPDAKTTQSGFKDPDSFNDPDEHMSAWESIKSAGANAVGNIGAGAMGILSSIPYYLNDPEASEKLIQEGQQFKQNLNEWANPENKEPTFGGKVAGALATLPAQLAAMPFQPYETGTTLINKGEDLPTAVKGAGISTLGNEAVLLVPGSLGNSLVTKIATGAASNVAQQAATNKAISSIAKTTKGKETFQNTPEDLAVAGIVGAGMGVLTYKGKSKVSDTTPSKKLSNLDALDQSTKTNLTVDKLPQNILDQQAAYNRGLGDEQAPILVDHSKQVELPFTDNVETIKAAQMNHTPEQMDMFTGNELPAAEPIRTPLTDTGTGERTGYSGQGELLNRDYPQSIQVPQDHLASAVDKLSKGQAFALSPEERIAWQKAQGNVDTSSGMNNLSADDIANKIQERQFAQEAVDKGQQIDQLWNSKQYPEQPLSEPQKQQQIADAWDQREQERAQQGLTTAKDASEDSLYKLQDKLTRGLNQEQQTGQGPKTRAFNAARGLGKNQSGGIDVTALQDAVQKGLDKLGDAWEKLSLAKIPTSEDYIRNNIAKGNQDLSKVITAPDNPVKTIEQARSAKDIPDNVHTNLKSGLLLSSKQFEDNPVLRDVGRWLQYAPLKADYQIRQVVQPVQKALNNLSSKHLGELMELMKRENTQGKRYTPEQLSQAGFTDRQINSYNMLRSAFDNAWEKQNEANQRVGKPPITKEEAYMSYSRSGDWHMPVYDKEGKLAWYVRANSRGEANKALSYLKDKFSDTLDLDKTKPQFYNDMLNPNVPRDVINSYKSMLKLFENDPQAKEIQAALDAVKSSTSDWLYSNRGKMAKNEAASAYNVLGQAQHFLTKAGIRGFEGDKPWLSEKENTYNAAQAQINYLKNAYRWIHMQESYENISKILGNEDIQKSMPNAVEYAKQVVGQQYGLTNSITRDIENAVAKTTGLSRGSLFKGIHTLKTATYLAQLGASPGYAIATPIQTFVNVPSWHQILTGEGFQHSLGKTFVKSVGDGFAGLARHIGYDLTGKDVNIPMSDIGKKALDYIENNGLQKSVFDESGDLSQSRLTQGAKNSFGGTISLPDKIARLPTFLSFVHHLDASGKFQGNEMEMFRYAKELTDNALGSFMKTERPLWVGKGGSLGEAAFTYKSFLFNQYNQWSAMAQKGRIAPLMTSLFMLTALGGALNFPGVQEADGIWNEVKNFIAKNRPQDYDAIKDLSVKGSIIKNLPEILAYGTASEATGAQMTSRFSPAVADVEHPLDAISPLWQEGREWLSAGKAALDPTKRSLAQAAWTNAPPLARGQMETRMDVFKGRKQGDKQVYLNPSDLNNPTANYARTKDQEFYRSLGLTKLDEYKDKNIIYMNNEESRRREDARNTAVQRIMTGILDNDPDRIKTFAITYLKMGGDNQSLAGDLNKALEKTSFTAEQRQYIHARTLAAIEDIQRLREMKKATGLK